MDIRSFELNFEVNATIYDEDVTAELERAFMNDLPTAVRSLGRITKNGDSGHGSESREADCCRLCCSWESARVER